MTRYPNVYSRSTLQNGKRIAAAGLWGMALACALLVCAPAAYGGPRTHRQGSQFTGKAIISDLQGNVRSAGDHIHVSGTNVWVRMYVQDSWVDRMHICEAYLGNDRLAGDIFSIKVNPCWGCEDMLRTDGSGDWQDSGNKGFVKFSTTGLPTATQGSLRIKLRPEGKADFFSNTIDIVNVQLYNKAYVLCEKWLVGADSTAVYVHERCEDMNHSATPDDPVTDKHNRDTILAHLPSYTIFYIAAHGEYNSSGNQTWFYDCQGDDEISSGQVWYAINQKTTQPYYNLVHLDTCHSSDHNDMAEAFGILEDGGGARADRAYIGWVGIYWGFPSTNNWTKTLWDDLRLGYKVGEAIDDANARHNEVGTARMYGDKNTVLHVFVYNGIIDPGPYP